MATIKIPPVLRPSVGGEKEIRAGGGDVGAVLRALADQHPATQSQLFGADDQLGMLNHVDERKRREALGLVREGRLYDLGRVLDIR